MKWQNIIKMAADYGLGELGALHETPKSTLILFGHGLDFYPRFRQSPEYNDGHPDPIDRWSKRIFKILAKHLNAQAVLPFGKSPPEPFIDFAIKSGRAWPSPLDMLVHEKQGLMLCYRGGLRFNTKFPIPKITAHRPCDSCADKPCLTACPVKALNIKNYDVDSCKIFLTTEKGNNCMSKGCAVRRICPISVGARRPNALSAYHMQYFVKN